MTEQSDTDADGFLFYKALHELRVLGSSKNEGWHHIRDYWKVLAGGGADPMDAAQWAQEIALRVVKDVLDAQPDHRRAAALRALGLVGVEGDHRKERDYVLLHEEFGRLAEEAGRKFTPKTRRQFARHMLDSGYFEGLSDKQAMAAIDHIKTVRPLKK